MDPAAYAILAGIAAASCTAAVLLVYTLVLVCQAALGSFDAAAADKRRRRVVVLPLVAALLLGAVTYGAPRAANVLINGVYPDDIASPPVVSEAARALHQASIVADLHADPLMWSHRDLNLRSNAGHVDVPRLLEGNVAIQGYGIVTKSPLTQNFVSNKNTTADVVTVVAMTQQWPRETWTSLMQRALWQSQSLHNAADASGGRLTVLHSRAELDAFVARKEASAASGGDGMTAGFLHVEGIHCAEGDVANIDRLYEAGVRAIGMAHFFNNEAAGSAHGEVPRYGLTHVGRAMLRRMEDLGIVVDLAHSSEATIDDVLEMARRPVLATHTGVRGTCESQRNLSDEQLRRIAATGGIVGVAFFKEAVCGTSISAIVEAILHAVKIAGPEHVSLGSDWDGAVKVPVTAEKMGWITDALLKAGLDEGTVRGVIGGNALRFLRETLPPK